MVLYGHAGRFAARKRWLPARAGKGSHGAMHDHQWRSTQESNSRHAGKTEAQLAAEWTAGLAEGLTYRQNSERYAGLDGYNSAAQDKLRVSEPLEVSGARGTVVLWHAQLAHVIGANRRSDCIRIASIHDFWLTPAALPDDVLRARRATLVSEPFPSLWDDWSAEVQAVPPAAAADAAVAARL